MRFMLSGKSMTYDELDRTLQPLGFIKKVVAKEKDVVYSHNSSDASVILTLRGPSTLVDSRDLTTVQKTVIEKGVATEARYKLLANRARKPRIPSRKRQIKPSSVK